MHTRVFHKFGAIIGLLSLTSLACLIGRPPTTAIPVGLPEDFEIQTATATLDARLFTPTPLGQDNIVLGLSDAPTHTPDPSLATSTPTRVVLPTATPTEESEALVITPTLTAIAQELAELTETDEVSETEVLETPTTAPVVASEPDPPLEGGDWDFETEFIPWGNPFGEPCPGARVASGWTAFVEEGPFGSSCMNENLYGPNVFSGGKSQEITFDFIAASSGVLRTIPTKVGHRYNIVAYAKHDRSISVVEMFLGVDLSGGAVWNAETVEWFPWNDGAEDTWVATEETVTATGDRMTILIRGVHPLAEQGGKTVVDNVSVTDLGP